MNNALIEMKNHVFRHSALERLEGSLSYGKSMSAMWFLKAWSNFVDKINAIRQFLGGEHFFLQKTEFIFLM